MEREKTELFKFLDSVNLIEYYDTFQREGFDRLVAIVDMHESDFEALGVKRGHRRIIQRRIQEISPSQSQPQLHSYNRVKPSSISPLLFQPPSAFPQQASLSDHLGSHKRSLVKPGTQDTSEYSEAYTNTISFRQQPIPFPQPTTEGTSKIPHNDIIHSTALHTQTLDTPHHTTPNIRQSKSSRQRGLSASSNPGSGATRKSSVSTARTPYSGQLFDESAQSPKRRYRRHPKKDPNAPEKWKSAYQLFRDDINAEYSGQNVEFAQMSKIHSKRWKAVTKEEKDMYEQRAAQAKNDYDRLMSEYMKTDKYKQHEDYLRRFHSQDDTVKRVGRPRGRKSSISYQSQVQQQSSQPHRASSRSIGSPRSLMSTGTHDMSDSADSTQQHGIYTRQ